MTFGRRGDLHDLQLSGTVMTGGQDGDRHDRPVPGCVVRLLLVLVSVGVGSKWLWSVVGMGESSGAAGVGRVKAPKWPTAAWSAPVFLRAAVVPPQCSANPEAYHRDSVQQDEAEQLCRGCGHLLACREYAMGDARLSGVWGGLTERERSLRRGREAQRRRVAARAVAV
jgi:hypothetical protein